MKKLNLKKVHFIPIYEQVKNYLKDIIVGEEKKPGDRLPPEPQLAKNLGIARMTFDFKDGLIYGVSGETIGEIKTMSELWSYDRKRHSFARLGPLLDREKNLFCDYPHGLTINKEGDRLYVAETDTPVRTSAVWECFMEL